MFRFDKKELDRLVEARVAWYCIQRVLGIVCTPFYAEMPPNPRGKGTRGEIFVAIEDPMAVDEDAWQFRRDVRADLRVFLEYRRRIFDVYNVVDVEGETPAFERQAGLAFATVPLVKFPVYFLPTTEETWDGISGSWLAPNPEEPRGMVALYLRELSAPFVYNGRIQLTKWIQKLPTGTDDVFVHEYMHGLNNDRGSKETTKIEYFKRPSEFRAFFMEGAYAVETYLCILHQSVEARRDPAYPLRSLENFVRWAIVNAFFRPQLARANPNAFQSNIVALFNYLVERAKRDALCEGIPMLTLENLGPIERELSKPLRESLKKNPIPRLEEVLDRQTRAFKPTELEGLGSTSRAPSEVRRFFLLGD